MEEKYRYFVIEGAELLDELARDLLGLEKHRDDPDLIEKIFRHVHKLKGAASVVRLGAISQLAHQMEDRLALFRDRKKEVSSQDITLLLEAATTLGEMLAAVKEGRPDPFEAPAPDAGPQEGAILTETTRIKAADLDRLTRLANEAQIYNHRLKNMVSSLARMMKKTTRSPRGMERKPELHQSWIDLLAETEKCVDDLERSIGTAADLSREMTDVIRAMRLVAIDSISHLFEKAARDLTVETGKDIDFAIEGGDLYLDRSLLDQTREPIFHLLRNSVIHGIEAPAERQSRGKAPAGSIRIKFEKDGGRACISCYDDGRGLDAKMIRDRAVQLELVDLETAASMPDDEALYLILRSGLSCADSPTELAGRGVGLDVVQDTVTGLGGSLEIESETGIFSRFTLTLPLSIDVLSVFAVRVAGRRLLLPLQNVLATRLVLRDEIAQQAGKPVIQFNGAPIPLVRLADLLGIATAADSFAKSWATIVRANVDTAALVVDGLEGRKEIMPRPLAGRLKKMDHLHAATILSDGDPAFVLDVPSLLEKVKTLPAKEEASVQGRPRPTVMVVDDSMTARRLIEGILSPEGYRVTLARSGQEALEMMEKDNVDLFVIDIQMPGIDGFELSERIRSSQQYRAAPIVILSTRGSDADKRRGIAVGANAYIVKGTFDQEEFLTTVGSLVA